MSDIEKVIKGLEECSKADFNPCMDRVCPYAPKNTNNFCDCRIHLLIDALELLKAQRETIDELISADKLLKEQDELLKHEYWRGYNNGRADERGLQEGTIMQTFSPD